MAFKTKLKDYISKIWPELVGVACSLIAGLLYRCEIRDILVFFISLSPWVIVFPLHGWLRKRGEKVIQSMVSGVNNCALSCLKTMKKISHDYPSENEDNTVLKTEMTKMCEEVFRTLANQNDEYKTIGYDKYCVFVSLIDQNNSGELIIKPLFRNHSDWSDAVFDKMPKCNRLDDNSPYKVIYDSYKNLKKPKIVMHSHIKEKIKNGKYKSTYANEVGLNNLPFDSSCILPILPFHNQRRGDEIQGYLTVVSEQSDAFKENIRNKESEAYFEIVSGYLYKICIKTCEINNKTNEKKKN